MSERCVALLAEELLHVGDVHAAERPLVRDLLPLSVQVLALQRDEVLLFDHLALALLQLLLPVAQPLLLLIQVLFLASELGCQKLDFLSFLADPRLFALDLDCQLLHSLHLLLQLEPQLDLVLFLFGDELALSS